MTNSVEPTPEEKAYRRVLFVAGFDGWSVVVVAGLGALLSLVFGSLSGILIGLLLVGAGVVELHGRRRCGAGMPMVCGGWCGRSYSC